MTSRERQNFIMEIEIMKEVSAHDSHLVEWYGVFNDKGLLYRVAELIQLIEHKREGEPGRLQYNLTIFESATIFICFFADAARQSLNLNLEFRRKEGYTIVIHYSFSFVACVQIYFTAPFWLLSNPSFCSLTLASLILCHVFCLFSRSNFLYPILVWFYYETTLNLNSPLDYNKIF